MSTTDQSVSFLVRFTQRLFEENEETKVQWLGNVSHVQGNKDMNFSDFTDAVKFIQDELEKLGREATKDAPEEDQDSILDKSFQMLRLMQDTIKDPKKGIAHVQGQIGELASKVPVDQWRGAKRSDTNKILESLEALTSEVKELRKKIDSK